MAIFKQVIFLNLITCLLVFVLICEFILFVVVFFMLVIMKSVVTVLVTTFSSSQTPYQCRNWVFVCCHQPKYNRRTEHLYLSGWPILQIPWISSFMHKFKCPNVVILVKKYFSNTFIVENVFFYISTSFSFVWLN